MDELTSKAYRILKNIPKRAIATARHQYDVEIDSLMRSAVKCMEILSRSESTTDKVMAHAWEIYKRLQDMSGTLPHKFMENDHNNPQRTESSDIRPHIKGSDWSRFYTSSSKGFDQYYRHGGNWRKGCRLPKKNYKNTTD